MYVNLLLTHHRRDELRGELEVPQVGELGGYEPEHGVLEAGSAK